jgi:hypothetical protein
MARGGPIFYSIRRLARAIVPMNLPAHRENKTKMV